MVRVDAPTDTTIADEAHGPRERLRDRDPARRTMPRLLNDEHDHVAQVACLLDLDVKAADRFGESFEKIAQLRAGAIGTDLIPELDLRVDQGIEVRPQLARPVYVVDQTADPVHVGLRHGPAVSRGGFTISTWSGGVAVSNLRHVDRYAEGQEFEAARQAACQLDFLDRLVTRGIQFVVGDQWGDRQSVPAETPRQPPKAKNPLQERASRKRLMGLEPTTFCMASST
jgi:hypothetical protein